MKAASFPPTSLTATFTAVCIRCASVLLALLGKMDEVLHLEKGELLFTVHLLTVPVQLWVTCRDYSMQMEFNLQMMLTRQRDLFLICTIRKNGKSGQL